MPVCACVCTGVGCLPVRVLYLSRVSQRRAASAVSRGGCQGWQRLRQKGSQGTAPFVTVSGSDFAKLELNYTVLHITY